MSVTEKTISLSPKLSHKSFKDFVFFGYFLKLVLDIVFAGFLPKGVGFQKLPIQRFKFDAIGLYITIVSTSVID